MSDTMIGGSDYGTELTSMVPWADCEPSISVEERLNRIERARALMGAIRADALLVPAGSSLLYFSGVGGGMIERLVAMIIPRKGRPFIVAPAFERGSLEAVLEMDAEARFWEEHQSPFQLVAQILRDTRSDTLAIDPAFPFGMACRLREEAPSLMVIDASSVVDGCRSIKSPTEVSIMRQAKQMTLEVQRRAARILHTGIRASEVKKFIDEAHRAIGSAGSSFCIVQFGKSTAYPHGLPHDDVLQEGDLVLIDTGCTVQGYNSDITRTYVFGQATDEQRHIWDIEKEAQEAAFAAARPGATCESVDRAARAVVTRHGLGPKYQLPGIPTRTGHGIGLTIHESPYLVPGDRTVLATGMCFSNEPMIVVPEKFGVRLEDHFHITDNGAEWFTRPSPAIDVPFA